MIFFFQCPNRLIEKKNQNQTNYNQMKLSVFGSQELQNEFTTSGAPNKNKLAIKKLSHYQIGEESSCGKRKEMGSRVTV